MLLPFHKLHGCENDFVLISEDGGIPGDVPAFARRVCPRRTGIGADGVLLLTREEGVAARMRIFNADGSEPEMCGNGVRCAAAWLVEEGWVPGPNLLIATGAGTVACSLLPGGEVEAILAVPRFDAPNLPVTGFTHAPDPLDLEDDEPIEGFVGTPLQGLPVSMGNPHCVILLPSGMTVERAPLEALAERVSRLGAFPDGVNVEVVERVSPLRLRVRVWERGVGETRACGTGAAAAAVVLGVPGKPVAVELPGGDLVLHWEGLGRSVRMRGAVEKVFRGQVVE